MLAWKKNLMSISKVCNNWYLFLESGGAPKVESYAVGGA